MSHNCAHRGNAVKVGPYEVLAGGIAYLRPEDFDKADVLIPFNSKRPEAGWESERVFAIPIPDFSGPPDDWREILEDEVIPLLEQGKTLLAYCTASRGRTGTFLASLIALLESEEETPDPIATVRERHCPHAVETEEQAEAVHALRA